ncbi:hypothetical protein ACHAWF_013193, partial [Thalassiosira exigua]
QGGKEGKERSSCECYSRGGDGGDSSDDEDNADGRDDDGNDSEGECDASDAEVTPDLIRRCGWHDGFDPSADAGGDFVVDPRPTVCQIGSNDPAEAAFAVRVARACGYDAVDLNCECPSDRVAGRDFGAALMKDREGCAAVVEAMAKAAGGDRSVGDGAMPVSVKTRIGVDDEEGFEFVSGFVQRLVEAGCNDFVIHARKVYTEGLSPAQNRDVPPLDYPLAYRLMDQFPQCAFVINGGISSLEHAREVAYGSSVEFDDGGNEDGECKGITTGNASENGGNGSIRDGDHDHVVPCQTCCLPRGSCLAPRVVAPPNLRGVMVGRLARDRPAELADVDRYFYGEACNPCYNRRELMDRYIAFLERVYPRRCCDDDPAVTLGMAHDMPKAIVPIKQCCQVCREFRGVDAGGCEDTAIERSNVVDPIDGPAKDAAPSGANDGPRQQTQSDKRARRHAKYGGAKIVTRIVDQSLAPTARILAGMQGKNAFRRASHDLSRDKQVRNCGPGYILWKAMRVVPDDVWDEPFEPSGSKAIGYYPSK